jgi:hypothetical protein
MRRALRSDAAQQYWSDMRIGLAGSFGLVCFYELLLHCFYY